MKSTIPSMLFLQARKCEPTFVHLSVIVSHRHFIFSISFLDYFYCRPEVYLKFSAKAEIPLLLLSGKGDHLIVISCTRRVETCHPLINTNSRTNSRAKLANLQPKSQHILYNNIQ